MMCRKIKPFLVSSKGVAAVEFAIILPVMIFLMIGSFELSRYLQAGYRATQVANNVGLMVSQAVTSLKGSDITQIRNLSLLNMPETVRGKTRFSYGDWSDRLQINLTSAKIFASPASAGTFDAAPIWNTTGSARRCGTLRPIRDGNNDDPSGIPAALLTGAGSVIIVDVVFDYRPIIGGQFLGARQSIPIGRTAFIQPRLTNLIEYANDSTNVARNCPAAT